MYSMCTSMDVRLQKPRPDNARRVQGERASPGGAKAPREGVRPAKGYASLMLSARYSLPWKWRSLLHCLVCSCTVGHERHPQGRAHEAQDRFRALQNAGR